METSSPVFRRSFSLPTPKPATSPDPQVEVLFNLPSVRIVAFTTSSTTIRPESRNGSSAVEEKPGTLPWVSRFERTIAVGMYYGNLLLLGGINTCFMAHFF